MKPFKISAELMLPVDVVTEKVAIIGRTGMGKSYTGAVVAEEMLANEQQICVIDLTGAWWGLRSAADGERAGFPIYVFGGDHGDIPLEPTAGAMVADLVAGEHVSVVLDLSAFESRAGEIRFVTDFLSRLYRKNKKALHLFLDESDSFAPQKPFKEEARCLGAVELVFRRGRIKGIGGTVLSQRSAVLNKNVLSQAGILVALQLTDTRDRHAVVDWSQNKDITPKQLAEILEVLPTLQRGEALVCWPQQGVRERVRIRARETFDSGKTPKPGEKRIEPKRLAPVDLEQLRGRMADLVEKAKADDPTALRRRIAELEAQLRKRALPAAVRTGPAVVTKVVPALGGRDLQRLESASKRLEGWRSDFELTYASALEQYAEILRQARALTAARVEAVNRATNPMAAAGRGVQPAMKPAGPPSPRAASSPSPSPAAVPLPEGITRPQFEILKAETELSLALCRGELPRAWVAAIAGASCRSSSFEKNVAALRTRGLHEYGAAGTLRITEQGGMLVPLPPRPLTADETFRRCAEICTKPQAALLQVAREVYPHAIARAELAARAGTSPTSSSFEKNVSALRSAGMFEYPDRSSVRAAAWMFVDGKEQG